MARLPTRMLTPGWPCKAAAHTPNWAAGKTHATTPPGGLSLGATVCGSPPTRRRAPTRPHHHTRILSPTWVCAYPLLTLPAPSPASATRQMSCDRITWFSLVAKGNPSPWGAMGAAGRTSCVHSRIFVDFLWIRSSTLGGFPAHWTNTGVFLSCLFQMCFVYRLSGLTPGCIELNNTHLLQEVAESNFSQMSAFC